MKPNLFAKVGAIFYVLWGLAHLNAARMMFGFILFVLLPGYLPMMPGAVGPILWIIALGLTTVAIRQADRAEQPI